MQKEKCVIVLISHAMKKVKILSDHIRIMTKDRLYCIKIPISLKILSDRIRIMTKDRLYCIKIPISLKSTLIMIPMQSPNSFASSIECDIETIVHPFFASSIMFHTRLFIIASIPIVQKSKEIPYKL